jgi:aspartokinase-like uncharacterized kinase
MMEESSMESGGPTIVKVGGSLIDLPGLGPALEQWLKRVTSRFSLLIPGGGPTADVIRALDVCHDLGEIVAHWLALRALSLNAAVLQSLLPGSQVIEDWRDAQGLCRRGLLPILDAFRFVQADEGQPGHLPHGWQATSDSLAARVAVVARARELILLKSVTIPRDMSLSEAAQCGFVDPIFGEICAQAGGRLDVRFVNFRQLPR